MLVHTLLVGPIIFILVTLILGKITPKYDWQVRYISELSNGKYGWIMKMNFIMCGIVIIGLAIFMAGKTDSTIIKIAWYMASLLGIPIAFAGIFDTDVDGKPTRAGKLHDFSYQIGMAGTGATYFLMGWGYRNFPLILVFSWLVAIFDLVWWKYSDKLGVKPGIGQRIVIFSTILWVEAIAIWTLGQLS